MIDGAHESCAVCVRAHASTVRVRPFACTSVHRVSITDTVLLGVGWGGLVLSGHFEAQLVLLE